METNGVVEAPPVEAPADVADAPTGEIITDNSISDSGSHWLDAFQVTPDERQALLDNPSLSRYHTGVDFLRGVLEREKLIGQKQGLEPLGEDASVEDRQAWYRNLPGQPNTANDYGVEPPTAPEGAPVAFDQQIFQGFLDIAHQWGVPGGAVDAIVRYFEKTQAEDWQNTVQADQVAENEARQALQTMWGPLTDQNLTVALESARREFGDLGWMDGLVTTDSNGVQRMMGNSPEFAKVLYEWGVAKGHDRFVAGSGAGVTNVQQARQQLDEARQQFSRGEMSETAFRQVQQRLAPIVYHKGPEGEDLVIGQAMTAVDFEP